MISLMIFFFCFFRTMILLLKSRNYLYAHQNGAGSKNLVSLFSVGMHFSTVSRYCLVAKLTWTIDTKYFKVLDFRDYLTKFECK